MDMWNIKNAKLTQFAFAMPPSCYWEGGNCFLLYSRAHYLVLYLSQGGKSLIFILPLNLCLCNLSGTGVSCLILVSITEREYIIQSLHLDFHLLGDLPEPYYHQQMPVCHQSVLNSGSISDIQHRPQVYYFYF